MRCCSGVSGAAGATGSVVGQLAKIAGCRAVGIAGGPEKCKWLVEEAGYDAAIDYKAGEVKAQIKEHCPRGVDVIFDNVGGSILDDMLANIATGARVVVCGGISRYETGGKPSGPGNYFNLIFRRASMAGFIVLDWASEFGVEEVDFATLLADSDVVSIHAPLTDETRGAFDATAFEAMKEEAEQIPKLAAGEPARLRLEVDTSQAST